VYSTPPCPDIEAEYQTNSGDIPVYIEPCLGDNNNSCTDGA
jgi:hypothetical protein